MTERESGFVYCTCGHTLFWHCALTGPASCRNVDRDDQGEYHDCECARFEKDAR